MARARADQLCKTPWRHSDPRLQWLVEGRTCQLAAGHSGPLHAWMNPLTRALSMWGTLPTTYAFLEIERWGPRRFTRPRPQGAKRNGKESWRQEQIEAGRL